MNDWRPSASPAVLQLRARLLARIRAFFDARGALEVETPCLSVAANPDPHIESIAAHTPEGRRYLHTSPEFPMKRLLAAGSGDIWQLARVFRAGEAGRRHNPEFSLLEWYRTGRDHHRLMDEVEDLLQTVLETSPEPARRLTYREAFVELAGIDPFTATVPDFRACACRHGIDVGELGEDPDAWRNLLLSHVVEPGLPAETPVFIHDWPASQAALARIRDGDPPVAERFELFWQGMELANGYHELTDPDEQRRRFAAENHRRAENGQPIMPVDERLLAALEHGLPDCAGVALGFDRLVMIAAGVDDIREVLAFDWDRA